MIIQLTTAKCKNCVFYTKYDKACNYLYITGNRRNCDIKECDKRMTKMQYKKYKNNRV